jgi:hypothetical protein
MANQISMKKYKVIAKIGSDKFVKYNVNNLLLFAKFLDKEFQDWRWFNVFAYQKDSQGIQLASFTKNNRPKKMYV